jgi:hypothetical protein
MGSFGQILEPLNSNVKIIIHCPKDKVYVLNKNDIVYKHTQITEGDSEVINFLKF